jgi:hypothetical protein
MQLQLALFITVLALINFIVKNTSSSVELDGEKVVLESKFVKESMSNKNIYDTISRRR